MDDETKFNDFLLIFSQSLDWSFAFFLFNDTNITHKVLQARGLCNR